MKNSGHKNSCALPELLSPAGDAERLEAAVRFGANAVYLAGKEFGMRSASPNFSREGLAQAVEYAHKNGVKVHLTCNTLAHNGELQRLPDFFTYAQSVGTDAFIIADVGIMRMAQKYAPKVKIHVSTQAGVVNYETAKAFYELGASRVVLARELRLDEIAEIRAKTPKQLELEAFVHGSMCVSFSGRCLLSSYLTGRDANRGECAQPCRWKYALMEETRPGQYMPIYENETGSYILNSKDLCMVNHLPELARAGITSFKIEGRAKSSYYTAVTANAYRHAIDAIPLAPSPLPSWIPEELEKISHREYSTGFYFGGEPGQVYGTGGYVRKYEVIAVCTHCADGTAVLSQRNRFYDGDTADVLEPGKKPYMLRLSGITDENGEPVASANHAQMNICLKTERPVAEGAIFRKKLE